MEEVVTQSCAVLVLTLAQNFEGILSSFLINEYSNPGIIRQDCSLGFVGQVRCLVGVSSPLVGSFSVN